jgi:hypothetical protein
MTLKSIVCCCLLLANMAAGYLAQTSGNLGSMRPLFVSDPLRSHPKPVSTELKMVGMIFDEDHLEPSSYFPSMHPAAASLSSSEIYVLIKLERWYSKFKHS